MKNDGGAAFPLAVPGHLYGDGSSEPPAIEAHGMTIRDYFAGQALMGWVMSHGGKDEPPKDEWLARWSYASADAMMAEREKES